MEPLLVATLALAPLLVASLALDLLRAASVPRDQAKELEVPRFLYGAHLPHLQHHFRRSLYNHDYMQMAMFDYIHVETINKPT